MNQAEDKYFQGFTSPTALPLPLRASGLLSVPQSMVPPATGSLQSTVPPATGSLHAQTSLVRIHLLQLPLPSTHTSHRANLSLAFRSRKAIPDLEWKSGSLHAFLEERCFSFLTLISAYNCTIHTQYNVNFFTPQNQAIQKGRALCSSTSEVARVKGHCLSYFILNNKVPFQADSLKWSQAMLIFVLKKVTRTIEKEIKIFKADLAIILEV